MRKPFPLSRVYQLLEPGPVTMVTTSHHGRPNVMTMSWHMMIDFEPPIFACVISNQNYTFNILKETQECVINIPSRELAAKAVKAGNVSGKKIDKIEEFHLKTEASSEIRSPLLTECYANLECQVIDMSMAEKYNIFILKVLKAWVRPRKKRVKMFHHCGKGVFVEDGKVFKLPSKKL